MKLTRRAAIAGLAAAGAVPARAQRDDDVPYVPTPPLVVAAMLDLAEVQSGERLIDLGSGDGRIVIAAAKRGADALGLDIDAALVSRARGRARTETLTGSASFSREDFFAATFRDADVVTMYLIPSVNLRLRPKLLTELRPGARVVSHAFDMGEWTPDAARVVEEKNVYLWIVPAIAGGRWRMAGGEVLAIEQRFQAVTGTLDSAALTAATLRGERLAFEAAGRRYQGVVGERAIEGAGWRAERIE